MSALIEIVIEGVKKFGGEIIAAVLLAVVLGLFPSLRKLFRKKNESDEEVKQQLEQLQSVLIIQKRGFVNSSKFSGRKNNSSPASKKFSSVMTQSCKIFRLKQKKKKSRKPIYRSR